MRVARPWVKDLAVIWRQRSMVLLCHMPTRQMVSVPMRLIRSATAAPTQRERTLTYVSVKPASGTAARMLVSMAAVISSPRMMCLRLWG